MGKRPATPAAENTASLNTSASSQANKQTLPRSAPREGHKCPNATLHRSHCLRTATPLAPGTPQHRLAPAPDGGSQFGRSQVSRSVKSQYKGCTIHPVPVPCAPKPRMDTATLSASGSDLTHFGPPALEKSASCVAHCAALQTHLLHTCCCSMCTLRLPRTRSELAATSPHQCKTSNQTTTATQPQHVAVTPPPLLYKRACTPAARVPVGGTAAVVGPLCTPETDAAYSYCKPRSCGHSTHSTLPSH